MNETLNILLNHRTRRHFKTGQSLLPEHQQLILNAAQQAPSWMNGQHYSIVLIDDNDKKEKLATLSPRNPHLQTCSTVLLFCLDMTLQHLCAQKENKPFMISGSDEILLTSVTDAALAMQNALIASESLGYGCVCVGGIRQVGREIVALCQLPKYTFPLCALCIGVIDNNKSIECVKPRIKQSIKVHHNVYQQATIEAINEYDNTMIAFNDSRETVKWSEKFAQYYSKNPNELTNELLKKQGF